MNTDMAYMEYPGSDRKFRVTSDLEDFHFGEDDFEIVVKDLYGRTVRRIGPEDCFWDSEGRWYFTLENVRSGVYYACFRGSYEDTDFDDQRRVFTDMQKLMQVGVRLVCSCTAGVMGARCECRHSVHYEEVFSVSIDGDEYLCDRLGRYILTADGKRICFQNEKAKQIEDMSKVRLKTMTGEQFVRLMEDFDPNSEVDTIPEVMHALNGINDETTVKEQIDEEVAESDVERVTREDLDTFEV